LAAITIGGWRAAPPGRRRTAWGAAGMLVALVFVVDFSGRVDRMKKVRQGLAHEHVIQQDLRSLVRAPTTLRSCQPTGAVPGVYAPLLALELERPPREVLLPEFQRMRRGAIARLTGFSGVFPAHPARERRAIRGFTAGATSRYWEVRSRGCSQAGR
jgi:hypothetical protein